MEVRVAERVEALTIGWVLNLLRFTGVKVQILTHKALPGGGASGGADTRVLSFTHFYSAFLRITSAKVQILTQPALIAGGRRSSRWRRRSKC